MGSSSSDALAGQMEPTAKQALDSDCHCWSDSDHMVRDLQFVGVGWGTLKLWAA